MNKLVMNKLAALIPILGLAACSLPDSKALSTLAQATLPDADCVARVIDRAAVNWGRGIVHQSRAEPLCPLC